MINIIKFLFGSQSRLEQIAREIKPIFQTQSGREEILKSILYSEFPLRISEYVFEIKDGQCVSLVDCTDERIEFLKKIFQFGLTKESSQQYVNYTNSAQVANTSNNPIFHTHPRNSRETYSSEKTPHFSPADKIFSKKNILGLVEYCVKDSSDFPIQILSRLSLCYHEQAYTFSEMQIALNPDGEFSSNDGEVERMGRVPAIASATENLIEDWIKLKTKDKLTCYVLQYAVTKLK